MTISIHQFHATLSDADAVSSQMLFIQSALKGAGIGGNLYRHEASGKMALHSLAWQGPQTVGKPDWLLIHHSQGNPRLPQILQTQARCALVYHNITPASFFPHDPYLADLCRLGREQLPLIKEKVEATFTVSSYNASELNKAGFTVNGLLPLLDFSQFCSRSSRSESPKALRLLFVGKLLPHKNQALLVETLAHLSSHYPQASLHLVGREDPFYGRFVRLLAKQWGVHGRVVFTGPIANKQLIEEYANASCFVCLSQHEGFCVPIVEALARGTPIFSTVETGLQDTLGSAGVQLLTRKPSQVSEIMAATMGDPTWRVKVQSTFSQELSRLTIEQNPNRITELLIPLLK